MNGKLLSELAVVLGGDCLVAVVLGDDCPSAIVLGGGCPRWQLSGWL